MKALADVLAWGVKVALVLGGVTWLGLWLLRGVAAA